MKLKAVILDCTLKKSPEVSNTRALIDKVVELMKPLAVKRDGECIVYSAEDCYNQSVQVHDEPPSGERQTLPLEGLVAWTSTFQRIKTCTRR